MSKLKVLVAGIDYAPNQFTRAIEKYGCETIHIDGRKFRGSVPAFADCAVVVSSYIGHRTYSEVKGAYQSRQKTIFVVGRSFTEMKEKFENWLVKQRGFAIEEGKVSVGELAVPEQWVDKKQPKEEIVAKKIFPGGLYTDEQRDEIRRIILETTAEGQSASEVAKSLNNSGIKKAGGDGKWNEFDVYNKRSQYKGEQEKKEAKEKPAPVKKIKDKDFDPVLLIQRIAAATGIDAMEKVNLIAKVSVGEIKQEHYTESMIVGEELYIESVSIFRAKADNPHIKMTRRQAALVLGNLKALKDFIDGGK